MKQIYCTILFSFSLFFSLAQKPFICTPSTNLSISLPPNTFTSTQINMINQTSGSLTLKWIRFTNSVPNTWACNLCDYNTCYSGVPSMGTMFPISGLTQGFIRLETNPFAYTGTGYVVIYVYSGSAPTLGDTLIFNFNASGVTSLSECDYETKEKEQVTLLPNTILFQNAKYPNEIYLINTNGQVLLQKSIAPNANEVFLTHGLPKGIYFLRTQTQIFKYLKIE